MTAEPEGHGQQARWLAAVGPMGIGGCTEASPLLRSSSGAGGPPPCGS